MQDAFDDEVAQFGHQDVGLGEVAQRDRQRADVIVMTVSEGDGLEFLFANEVVERQALPALVLGVSAGVH